MLSLYPNYFDVKVISYIADLLQPCLMPVLASCVARSDKSTATGAMELTQIETDKKNCPTEKGINFRYVQAYQPHKCKLARLKRRVSRR